MSGHEFGSLTKEPPLKYLDDTIVAIRPGMSYGDLLEFARNNTHRDAPGLIQKRFISVGRDKIITYDRFLSLVSTHGIRSALVRKVMLFVWAYRDERIRRFICERVADKKGKWRFRELRQKRHAEFFEEWLQPGASRKARSNVEFFLAEAGIFDPSTGKISLNLDDGWLDEAAVVAAQHEEDPTERRRLLDDPAQFLIGHGWTALANATADELLASGPSPIEDAAPLEDSAITLAQAIPSPSKEWNRRRPKPSDRRSTNAYINLVARERASQSHHLLEAIVAELVRARGYRPEYNEHIDLHFRTPAGVVLAEMKSCDDGNVHSQIRKGVSQLFEYRYVYRKVIKDPVLLLVLEARPPADKLWLVEFLQSLDITVAWKQLGARQIATTNLIPGALAGIVRQEEN